jgi:hypothetical protein
MWKNQKSICEIKKGNGIILHMWKNLLWRAHKEKTTEKVAISDCASSLACCSACSWPKVMYKQVAIGKVMSAVPYMSGFLFRFAVFLLLRSPFKIAKQESLLEYIVLTFYGVNFFHYM